MQINYSDLSQDLSARTGSHLVISTLFILSVAFIIYYRFQQYNFFAKNDNFVFVAKKSNFFGNVKNSILVKLPFLGNFI